MAERAIARSLGKKPILCMSIADVHSDHWEFNISYISASYASLVLWLLCAHHVWDKPVLRLVVLADVVVLVVVVVVVGVFVWLWCTWQLWESVINSTLSGQKQGLMDYHTGKAPNHPGSVSAGAWISFKEMAKTSKKNTP